MKNYKKSIQFLIQFFITYFVLFALYAVYLQKTQQKDGFFECSPITSAVAKQTVGILNFLGYDADYNQHEKEMSVKLLVDDVYTARVIEGCNSISIIILFVAFIVAFSGGLKATVLYAIFGSVVIYIINLLRIAFLTIMLSKYPTHQYFLHNLVFPAIIYGATFLLWVLWVHKFSYHKK